MWAQAVLLRIVLCVEGNSTSESREPVKLCPAASCREAVKKPKPRGGGCIGASFPLTGEFIPGLSREDEGAGALHCAPGRTIQHTAPRAAVPNIAVYASASHSAMHTPAGVAGFEPARPLVLETRPTGCTPYDSFLAGESETQWWADGRPLLAWYQRFSGCTPRAAVLAGRFITRALCTWGNFRHPDKCRRRVGKRYPRLVRSRYNQGNFRCPGISCIWR